MLMTQKQTANRLGITVGALRELVGKRAIAFIPLLPRRTRFESADVEKFIASRRVHCHDIR